MRPGDVLFYRGTSFISKAIAWVENSPYTHVALYIGDNQLIEANSGIKSRIRDIEPSEDFEVHSFKDITDDQRDRLVKAARHLVGYKYDYAQIVRDFIRIEFHTYLSFIQTKNAYICSDIIDVPAYIAGIKRHNFCPVGDITPSELFLVYNLPKAN